MGEEVRRRHRRPVLLRSAQSARLVRRVYSPDEIDAFAVYCEATDRCYFLRCDQFGGRTHIQLRLVPSKNNQQEGINWAKDFEFAATLSRPKGP